MKVEIASHGAYHAVRSSKLIVHRCDSVTHGEPPLSVGRDAQIVVQQRPFMRSVGVREENLVVVECGRVLAVVDAGVVDKLDVGAVGHADAGTPVPETDIVQEGGAGTVLIEDETTSVAVVLRDVQILEGDSLFDQVVSSAALHGKKIDATRPRGFLVAVVSHDRLFDMQACRAIVGNSVDRIVVGNHVDVLEVAIGHGRTVAIRPPIAKSARRAIPCHQSHVANVLMCAAPHPRALEDRKLTGERGERDPGLGRARADRTHRGGPARVGAAAQVDRVARLGVVDCCAHRRGRVR